MTQWLRNPTRNHEVTGLIPGIAVSYGVGRRYGLDPVLLWLWCRLAATALIRPLAWEPPYATEAALEIDPSIYENLTYSKGVISK